jgi:hypothetical protein
MTQLLTPAADASADGPDAVILAAFARRRDALRAVAALTEQPEFGKVTAEEHDLIAVADQAEQEILDTMALTPEGVAAKIWVAMHHEAEGSGPDTWAMVDSDLPGLEAVADELDWSAQLTLSALRSLRAMEASARKTSHEWTTALDNYTAARREVDAFVAKSDGEEPDFDSELDRLSDISSAAFAILKETPPTDPEALAVKISVFAHQFDDIPLDADGFEILRRDAARLAARA